MCRVWDGETSSLCDRPINGMQLWSTEVQRLVRHISVLFIFVINFDSKKKIEMELKCDTDECRTQKSICLRCAKFALAKAKMQVKRKKSKTIVTYYGTVIVLKMKISGSHSDRGSESFRSCVETEVAECPCVSYRIRHRTHTPANNNFVLLFYSAFVVLY